MEGYKKGQQEKNTPIKMFGGVKERETKGKYPVKNDWRGKGKENKRKTPHVGMSDSNLETSEKFHYNKHR